MKKIKLLLWCFVAINFYSCSSEEADESNKTAEQDEQLNSAEDELLSVNAVTEDIVIQGANKVNGSPTPNGDITFSLDYTKQSAFQGAGFDIEFEAPQNFAGVYIQLKDENGMADSYFDVPESAIENYYGKSLVNKKNKGVRHRRSRVKKIDSDKTLEVNFGDNITAGTFCYLICVYDTNGYISAPSEVCVTVESWAGNSALVGEWDFTKEVENGIEIVVGVEDCESESYTLSCISGEALSATFEDCYTIDSLEIKFNADGSYSFESKNSYKELDYDASENNCSVVYSEENDSYKSSGNWAFNEEENKITLVEFNYEETYDGETEVGVEPNGYLLLDGKIEITGNTFKITEKDSYDGIEEIYEYYFSKK